MNSVEFIADDRSQEGEDLDSNQLLAKKRKEL